MSVMNKLAVYEMNDRGRIPALFAWRSGAQEEFEVRDVSWLARCETTTEADFFIVRLAKRSER
jgi:hypothetical protein